MADQLSSIRRTFDERLLALETGLADPASTPALDVLVVDLLRAVEDEAEASAKDAAMRAQRSAEALLANAMAQAQAAHVQLDEERGRSEALRTEISSLKEKLAAAVEQARQYAATAAADATAKAAAADAAATATARLDAAIRERDEIARTLHAHAAERDALLVERESLLAERTALAASRDSVIAERDAAAGARDAVTIERDALIAERNSRSSDQHLIVAERDALLIERNALVVERNALMTARSTVTAERDRLVAEREDFVRTHDAMLLQRDTLVHERDDIARDRDRQIAQLHKDLEEREAALKDAREKAVAPPAAPAAAAKPGAATPAAPGKKSKAFNGPPRKSDRQAFNNALGVQIDGEAALLVDLSVSGAQVLSCAALKPEKTVKMLLPSSESPVLCRGRIVWSRLEPTTPGKPIRYRAGLFFTATDQAAVQTFITRHGRS